MAQLGKPAPAWKIQEWVNGEPELSGRVVVALAFQMLCPGCATQALPQMQRVRAAFSEDDVAVVGLHTVFEHHDAMTPAALRAFAHEHRYGFPIGVDEPNPQGGIPATMAAYNMQGTPTLLLIDRRGVLRRQTFGHAPDLQLGAEIMALALEGGAGG
ncbi:MAG TPA: TlpA disulfide reductase family protein [Caulobacteraceae bacterium]|nr:TlpA disulfide reductase family protein [Caulobacteraceae bacterium]